MKLALKIVGGIIFVLAVAALKARQDDQRDARIAKAVALELAKDAGMP